MNKGVVIGIIAVIAVIVAIFAFTMRGDNQIVLNSTNSGETTGNSQGSGTETNANPIGNTGGNTGSEGTASTSNGGGGSTGSGSQSESHTVEYTASGFVPETLNIHQGDTVTFVNRVTSLTWPASDNHPTHTVYPGSGIQKCNTPEKSTIFDACEPLGQGESYSFTFNSVGTWNYHDHRHPNDKGTIIVS